MLIRIIALRRSIIRHDKQLDPFYEPPSLQTLHLLREYCFIPCQSSQNNWRVNSQDFRSQQFSTLTNPPGAVKMLTMFTGTKITELPPGVTTSPSPQPRARGISTSTNPTSQRTAASDTREERRRIHHEADVVIVGAGIVGCAAAVAFGNQGRSVILLEKSLKEPDRIVGELLQPGGVNALEKLGMRGVYTLRCFGMMIG
jgi:hypothetical protein